MAASNISSVILKNVVAELQNNVTAEMSRFQQQILALDSIIRHSNSVAPSETPVVTSVSQSNNHDELCNIHNQLTHITSRVDKHTELLDIIHKHMNTAIANDLNKLSETYVQMNTSVAKSFEVLGNAFNQQTDRIISLEAKYAALESRVAALTINNIAKECIENKTDIIMESPEEIIKETTTPPNTPSSSDYNSEPEPDIEETNVNYESEAEPDIEDNVPEPAEDEPEVVEAEETEAQEETKEGAEKEADETEEVEGEEVEEEEEAEVEYEEVTYKGTTYYVDPDNIAYTMDDEGSLNEDPVGVWVPEKKIVRFYKK